ncbi:SMP-30/gluconolactonase/LRE family protein [Asticcacaulis sp. AND118]|uniref:SMP-30/gluconolactonase/LRE family protein n=1 Tax=Asticcacaulis sp. AND118 TaxID=2840468 RepID=UPI001CFFD0D4|nr:SMP-30/gluconolactonase/LRE family protein [Asticcacaulis sp. AND118]UDF05090.1 SMP-30/gluconolactonase/LRE family protein [Asticcacaulis sp. AND118]
MITRRHGLGFALAALTLPLQARAAEGGIRGLAGAGDALGEGPYWSPALKRLLWVNISGQTIYALDLKSGDIQTWKTPKPVCFLADRKSGGLIAGLSDGVYAFDPKAGTFTLLVRPETRDDTRLNDGKVDAKGRLWTGTMDTKWKEKVGAFYRVDADLKVTRADSPYLCANGPTFSPDGRTLWHAETYDKTVFAFDVAADGALSNKRVFVKFDGDMGSPDGMTTDAQGGVWIAHYGGGRVSRFKTDGTLDFSIALPATQITSLVFGGAALDHLYISSAAQFLPENAPDKAVAGTLFEVSPARLRGHAGLPATPFAG